MPAISVIVPVHNAGVGLRECLDSLLAQTFTDIEVLCIDDGSTDDSPSVLAEYANRDPRLRVVRQENVGAGAARNVGLDLSTGDYLLFLDADDFFEPVMLERMMAQSVDDDADIAICRARHFDMTTGRYRPADWLLKDGMLPIARPFSRDDIPQHVLLFTSSVLWNKLFRRAFVIENGLRFQDLRRANDLYFTSLALVRAKRITTVDEVLVNYRVGNEESLQATNSESPLDFCRALLALKETLVASGEFELIERGFVNHALRHCIYNLDAARTFDDFIYLYSELKERWVPALGITEHTESGYSDSYYFPGQYTNRFLMLLTMPPEEYLFRDAKSLRIRLSDTRVRMRKADSGRQESLEKLKQIRNSTAYKLGRRLTTTPRWFMKKTTTKQQGN